jgi:putative glutamine amidotransferase
MADAILLPGGGDLSPHWYGQQPHPTLYGVNEDQDTFNLTMARWAILDKIPLLVLRWKPCHFDAFVAAAR